MPFRSFFIRAFTLLFLSSVSASAALIPCATAANPQICSLCDILVLGNNLTNWFAGILLPLGILAFGISGVLYLIQKPDQAKSLMSSAAKGIIISLSAFLIVNITLRALDVVQPTSWNTFTCTSQVAAATPKTDGTTFNTSGDGGPKDTVGSPGDITGDPTILPTTPICNVGRDTSAIPMAVPLSLTLDCTNPANIVSAIWRFPSDSNFRTQNIDSAQAFRGGALTDTITFTSIENPSSWNDVTVVVTDNQGRSQTYTYGFGGGSTVASCNTTAYTGSYGGASARIDCTAPHEADSEYGSLGILGCTVNHTWSPGNLGIKPVSRGNGAFVIEYTPGDAGGSASKYWTTVFTSQAPASSETRVARLEVAISSQPNDFTSSNVIQKATSTSRVDQGLLSYGEFSPILIMPRQYPHKLYINVRPTGYYDMTRGTQYADEELTIEQLGARGLGYPYQSFYMIPNALSDTYPGLENSCVAGGGEAETPGDTRSCGPGTTVANLDYTNVVADTPVNPVASYVYKIVVPSNAQAISISYFPNNVPGPLDVAWSTQRPCAYGDSAVGYTNSFTGGGTLAPTIVSSPPSAPYLFGAKIQAGSTIYMSVRGKPGVTGVAKLEMSLQ